MPPDDQLLRSGSVACCVALGASGLALLGRRLFRHVGPETPWLPGVALLAGCGALAAASLGASPAAVRVALLGIVTAAAIVVPPEPLRPASRRPIAVLAAAGIGAAAAFPALRLFDPTLPSRSLFIWERAVLWGFEQEMKTASSFARALVARLAWREGLLSTGGDSLLYGFPTLVLLDSAPPSVLLLRLTAALLALASVLLAWVVCQRIHGATAGTASLWIWLTAPAFVVYSFYGTSVTAMWVSIWLAIGAVQYVVSRPSAGAALLAVGALYLATLQYAPGRLVATGLFVAALGALAFPGAPSGRGRAIAILFAGAAALVAANVRAGRGVAFYAARGENVVAMRGSPDALAEYLGRLAPAGPLGWSDTFELSGALLRQTGPEFAGVVAPVNPLEPESPRTSSNDPPHVPLILAPALSLVIWGFVLSVRPAAGAPRTGRAFAAAFLLASGPLLLTNRVDVARAATLLPFLAMWGGLGAADLGARLSRSLPHVVVAGIGVVFFAGLLLQDHAFQPDAPLHRNPAVEALVAEIGSKPGAVRIVSRDAEIDAAWLEAILRLRTRPDLLPAVVDPTVANVLLDRSAAPSRALDLATSLTRDTALLLAPASDFSVLRRAAEAHGLRSSIGGTAEFPVLRLERRGDQ